MNNLHRFSFGLVAVTAAVSVVSPAPAQMDIGRPAPNVLLLVDTSGSMEYKASSSAFPTCSPTGADPSEKSRWVDLLEVLTGSIEDYRCEEVDRHNAAFQNAYRFLGVSPYDYGYEIPYHRPMSSNCRWLPGSIDAANAFEFPDTALIRRDRVSGVTCDFRQSEGLLDSFETLVRFGLMTFDTLTDPGTGYSGLAAQPEQGMNGAWSYFGAEHTKGRPAGCGFLVDYEVGARNAAAPPWEGRMVAFGDRIADQNDRTRRNQQIQKILLATRPYLATPIAGLLDDAKQFLWNDTSMDPLSPADDPKPFGPSGDEYILGGCRDTHIILLTDGEPNLDLRPHCALEDPLPPPAGVTYPAKKCPYELPQEIAYELAHASPDYRRVKTHVIGFALSELTVGAETLDCATLSDDDLFAASGACATAPESAKQLKACCTLNEIAFNGDTGRARFANDVAQLRRELMEILIGLVEGTSRTRAVYVPSGPPDPNAAAYRFFSGFTPHPTGWRAQIERQRWVCASDPAGDPIEAHGATISAADGDDFSANVNSAAGEPRVFYTVKAQVESGNDRSARSIRPSLESGDDDGAGTYGGLTVSAQAEGFSDVFNATALGSLPTEECSAASHTSPADCAGYYVDWWVGLNNESGEQRCSAPGTDCARLGAIYHSTPVAVNRPSELLRDETYDIYASSASVATRPLMLYTSTTDGFLHAFKVTTNDSTDTFTVNSRANNELWAFAPPAILGGVPGLFSNPTSQLLDGAPVVREVIATPQSSSTYGFSLERSPGQMRNHGNTWRTVLVQGFGESSGYFALDVTDPESGPQFLWQLTTDSTGQQLFGDKTSTPLITTLYFAEGGTGEAKEVAVAILPGGRATYRSATALRATTDLAQGIMPTTYDLRAEVPSYGAEPSDIYARSLTIVRLDNGKIIKTFRRASTDVSSALSDTVIVSPLDSPISGEPAAFPGATGAVADRIFVGDADGTLWRVNVSSTDPSNWRMHPFFDLHTLDATGDQGQPVVSAPVLSTREDGTVTVLVASGDQQTFTPTGTSYVWSLDDALKADYWDGVDAELNPNYSPFAAKANWYLTFTNGERVAGPMALHSKIAYFATYTPAPLTGNGVCGNGTSKVWGMDYVEPKDLSHLESGGLGRIVPLPEDEPDPTTAPQFVDAATSSDIPGDAAIFGVTIAMVPSCSASAGGEQGSGSGHRRITSQNPPTFQLLLQTGSAGSSPAGGTINFTTLDVAQPQTAPTIDSWVAILE